MKKPHIVLGADYASLKTHDFNTEVLVQMHPDGTQEILEIYRWKETIELPHSSYREKEVEADNFR